MCVSTLCVCQCSAHAAGHTHTHTWSVHSLPTGVIQCTNRDEFSYQEMITHLPMCALEVRFLCGICACIVLHTYCAVYGDVLSILVRHIYTIVIICTHT